MLARARYESRACGETVTASVGDGMVDGLVGTALVAFFTWLGCGSGSREKARNSVAACMYGCRSNER
jgi:hypothetical protein